MARLRGGETIAAVAAIALLLFMWFDWYDVSVESRQGDVFAPGDYAVGGNAWDALSATPIILVLLTVVVLGVVVARASAEENALPLPGGALITAAGAIASLMIFFRLVSPPDEESTTTATVDLEPELGIFLALIAAIAIAVGGYLTLRAEGTRLSDVGVRRSDGGPRRGTEADLPEDEETASAGDESRRSD